MADLTDEQLASLRRTAGRGAFTAAEFESVVSELQRRRAEQAAGREHVERVVREAVLATERTAATAVPIHEIDNIVRRAADRLSVPVLSAEEREHVSYFASRMRDELPMLCSILDRLIAGAKP